MTIVCFGIDHHQTDITRRERLYIQDAQIGLLLDRLCGIGAVIESLVLSTCNRLELYAVIEGDIYAAQHAIMQCLCEFFSIARQELEACVQIWQDEAAITHLLRVAAGLESMILGEPQILGQVRHALDVAEQVGTADTLLHRLFMAAIHTGKRARTETHINRHTTSIAQAAVRLALEGLEAAHGRVLIIGAGEMGALALTALSQYPGIEAHLINRSRNRAEALAAHHPGVCVADWSERREQIAAADRVIVATGAHQPVIRLFDITRRAKPLLLIDIAVPRNVDYAVRALPGIVYRDIDTIQQVVDESQRQRLACVPEIEAIIQQESAQFNAWLAQRQVIPTIKDLRARIHQLVNTELDDALGKLEHLDEKDRAVIQRMAHRITNTMLHEPVTGLKKQAPQNQAYAEVVRSLFALDAASGS